jgi:hypothetical protein
MGANGKLYGAKGRAFERQQGAVDRDHVVDAETGRNESPSVRGMRGLTSAMTKSQQRIDRF